MVRYVDIAGHLRQRIIDGGYASHTRLPSNRELAVEFDTTLVTVRKALELLTDSGWLRVEHGSGTFVADVGRHADILVSFTPNSVHGVDSLETTLLAVERDVCSADASAALGLAADASLVRLDRLRLADGRPVIHQSSYLDGRYAAGLAEYSPRDPLYVFLREELRLIATTSHEIVGSGLVPPALAAPLELALETPVMRSRKTSYTEEDAPFLYDDAVIVTSRMPLVIERKGVRSTVHFVSDASSPAPVRVAL